MPGRGTFAKHELGADIFYFCCRHGVKPPTREVASDESPPAHTRGGMSPLIEEVAPVAQLLRNAPLTAAVPAQSFEPTPIVPAPGRTAVSLLSFNLLAPCFVRVEGQPWNAFAFCDDERLAWERRRPRILELLQKSEADVICLQEVVLESRTPLGGDAEQWMLPAWLDELRGYTPVLQGLKQKDWEHAAQRNLRVVGHKAPTAVAIFYKADRFEEFAPSKHGSGSGSTIFIRCRQAPEDAGPST